MRPKKITETVSTAVITGRRMKGSERFMLFPGLLHRRFPRGLRRVDPHLAAGDDAEVTHRDDLLVGSKSLLDDDAIALLPLSERHRPELGHEIVLHHVDEGAFHRPL